MLIAEDEAHLRRALASFIAAEPTLRLVGAAGDATEAIELAEVHRPDVALLDVKMPGGGGPRAARGIRERSPQTRVVALSAYDDRATVLEMLRAGAVGYLVKGTGATDILDAIHATARGQATLSVEVTADVVGELAEQLQRQEHESEDRLARLRRIRDVLENQPIAMAFQPIVDLRDRSIVGYEALARFGTAPVSPEAWLSDAESLGLRDQLELAAVDSALRTLARIPAETHLAVNLSPHLAMSGSFLDMAAAIPPGRLVVEITEHAKVDDYDELNEGLARLRSRGVRLAVDDAGAGFASLRHIVRVAPEFIKLDITLTRGIDGDPARRALATALISFAAEIGASIIAEGVESEAEFQTLRSLGASYAQGFFFGMPAPMPAPVSRTGS